MSGDIIVVYGTLGLILILALQIVMSISSIDEQGD